MDVRLCIFLFAFFKLSWSAPVRPGNPFGGAVAASSEYEDAAAAGSKEEEGSDEYYSDAEESTRQPIVVPKQYGGVTAAPVRQNIMFTLLPTLQKKTYSYCPNNQYTFMLTCKPGKKLRYDLQVFCQDYSEQCGVPNIHLYPSRQPQEEWKPEGYGQKQQNGKLGLGRSFNFGLGLLPGFELTSANGADIGNIPGLEIGGLMFNEGTDVGIMGERIGKAPARTIGALANGLPSFGLDPNTAKADQRAANAALRQLGIPPVPGLAKALGKLQPTGLGKRPSQLLYEPGYNAVDKNAPFATGRTDGESVNLPATLGKVELLHGVGMGIGKK